MAKSIMIQGTTSNAGKSFVAAALCRVLRQDGYRVAPFKSQNMALNSFITKEGLEMGRAQVMQAQAAELEPSVLMNPILLKPTSESGSQVIVNGEVWGNMTASEYYRHKKELIPHIMRAYQALSAKYDVIVLEGAGSPAEINLKSEDIVNMGMAKMSKSPVLLVGDIDRGGVFASLAGTLMLLEQDEWDMVRGLLINKFRGDVEILRPGLSMLEEIAQKSVLGVIPYMRLDLDDEDSLSERLEKTDADGLIDIAVIRLPRISNFTDFNVLAGLPGVSVRYVTKRSQLGNPDIIFLPGTKNTMGDLAWMRENGLAAKIKEQASRGKIVFGICGGYQMLGRCLSDPFSVEHGGEMEGLGLLPANTVFKRQKRRTQVKGHMSDISGPLSSLSGAYVEGYEIHMGNTDMEGDACALVNISDGKSEADGLYYGNVFGSYIHGIFDNSQTASLLVRALCSLKGIDADFLNDKPREDAKKGQYDLLADGFRKSVDMDRIYQILEEGI